jgi:hypothetical protein
VKPILRLQTARSTYATLRLPQYSDLGNLVRFLYLPHTRFTYHRTWETGLEAEIRVADFSPAFFCPQNRQSKFTHPSTPPETTGFPDG